MNKFILFIGCWFLNSFALAQGFIENPYYKKIDELNKLEVLHIPNSEDEFRQHVMILIQDIEQFIDGLLPVKQFTAEHLNYAIGHFSDSELKSYLPIIPVQLFADTQEFFPPLYTLHNQRHTETLLALWSSSENRKLFKEAELNSVIFALGQCDTNRAIELAAVEGAPENLAYKNYYYNLGCP